MESSNDNALTPTQIMNQRFLSAMADLPCSDFTELRESLSAPAAPREQFASEYSQCAYNSMCASQDSPIGDYVTQFGIISATQRERMVCLIHELHRQKEYKVETLHLAVSIADRYLAAIQNAPRPNLVHLATVAVLMAAKLE